MDSSAVATSVPGVDAYDAEMQKLLSINPQEGVGKRHHTVPAFYLRYFADGDRLNVARAPEDPKAPVLLIPRANLNDLAHRDFYTAIVDTPAGERALDGGLEHILSYLEGRAAKVLGRLRSPLLAARWVPDDEFHDVIQFVSFQIVRGVRPRREQELLADYVMRMTAEGTVVDGKRMTLDELSRIRVVPHQNHHLKNLGAAAEAIFEHLKQRPLSIFEIDEPLFHTGDEPVLIIGAGADPTHVPECFRSNLERKRRHRAARAAGTKYEGDILHFQTTRPNGVALADEVLMPIGPRLLLILGPIGCDANPYIRVRGPKGREIADAVNERIREQAYLWTAAHPDHPTFDASDGPTRGPLIRMCDGGTTFSAPLKQAPLPLNVNRLRKSDVHEPRP